MRLLSAVDLLFLGLEKRQQPMHVGGLFLFRLPPDAPADFVHQLVQDMRNSRAVPIAPFHQVLNRFFWDEDQEFDLDQHFRHIALPRPGRIRELLTYISQEHAALMDRAKPLWECHIIEGIEGNRFAMYFKVHHALVDGVGAMRLTQKSLSTSPEAYSTVPLWAIKPPPRPQPKRIAKPKGSTGLLSMVKQQAIAIPHVLREVWSSLEDMRYNPDFVSTLNAPMSILNQPVSASRRFAAQSYDFERLRAINRHLDCTLNDLVLAIGSGALRSYLISQRSLPKKPMIAMVPVSLRKDDSDSGNQITMILANLATHNGDPIQRLRMIQRSVNNSKQRFSRMSPLEILSYSGIVYSIAGLNLITGILPRFQAFNLVISNVPGPTEPLYWNGAQLDALYPVSIVLDGQALNITLTTYRGKLEVGILACRKTLPHIQTLLGFIEEEIQKFEEIVALMPKTAVSIALADASS